jgi:purine nucleosidase
MAIKVIVDTDIGEDIDDIIVTAFALLSPEFEVLAITTVDGDVQARSRIARRLTATVGKPEIPVAAGYGRPMPHPDDPQPPGAGVRQGELAPEETGLPPACELKADELIATLAARYPGEVTVVTIGAMSNVGWALVRFPETARHLKAVVSNGGNFAPGRETSIGWNLRYDPLAAATVAMSHAKWVLLPESCTRFAALREVRERRLRESGHPVTDLLTQAIAYWRKNKADATPQPHVSDLNVFAYLLGGWLETRRGRVTLGLAPDRLPELRVEEDGEGPHWIGGEVEQGRAGELREVVMGRLLGSR